MCKNQTMSWRDGSSCQKGTMKLAELTKKLLNPLRYIPKGQDFIWWLIEKERRSMLQAAAPLIFLALFTLVFWLTFKEVGRSVSLAFALTMQMYLHEQGHAFVFRKTGIQCKVWWLIPLGAVAAPIDREEDARSDRLPWYSIAWITQAGVTVNVILMIVGLVIKSSRIVLLSRFGSDLVYAGGMLAISNLLPFWQLDARLLFKVLFASLKENDDIRYAGGILLLAFLGAVGIFFSAGELSFWPILAAILLHFGWLLILAVIAAGIWHQQGIDDPTLSASPQAMTRSQALMHVLWYAMLFYVAMRLVVGPIGGYV
jgi:Zn-dependent protease